LSFKAINSSSHFFYFIIFMFWSTDQQNHATSIKISDNLKEYGLVNTQCGKTSHWSADNVSLTTFATCDWTLSCNKIILCFIFSIIFVPGSKPIQIDLINYCNAQQWLFNSVSATHNRWRFLYPTTKLYFCGCCILESMSLAWTYPFFYA